MNSGIRQHVQLPRNFHARSYRFEACIVRLDDESDRRYSGEMAPTIVLILKTQEALDLALQTFWALGRCIVEPRNSFQIHDSASESWARAWLDEDIEGVYENDEPRMLEFGRYFLLVEWRDRPRDFVNEFLVQLDGLMTGVVDNDHGLVATLSEARDLIQGGIDWRYLKRLPAPE